MNQSENERVEFEINLKEMFQTLWEEKKRISYIILGFFLFSILYSLFLTNYYQSESLLQIRSQSTASSQISQIPGLSNMGINLPPSGDYRKSKGWKCEQCNKDCSHDTKNLHCHHIGPKYDNNWESLKALCKDCHKLEPFHNHMM